MNNQEKQSIRTFLRRIMASEYLILILCVFYFLAVWPFEPKLASPANIKNILSNLYPLLIVAIGQTFVLIAAGIDLSVTSVIALSSVTGALIMNGDTGYLAASPWAVPLALLAMIAVGAAIGLLNGLAVTWFSMPPFIVTLTTLMFFSGFSIWLTQSQNIYNLPAPFVAIGSKSLFFLPHALSLVVGIATAAHVLLRHTLLGRWLYAVGMNAKTAHISGVPVSKVVISAYVFSGVCASLASILYTARLETGSPVMGERILLDVIGAVVIGGTSLFGGKGKISWTIFGVLFITLLSNSLDMLGLSYFTLMMVKGTVILLAALIDVARNRFLIPATPR